MAVAGHAWLRSGEARALVASREFQEWLSYKYPDALYRPRLDEDETIRIIQQYLRERRMHDPFDDYQRQMMMAQQQAYLGTFNQAAVPKAVSQKAEQKAEQYKPSKPAYHNPKLLLIRR